MSNEWLIAESFERLHELISAINTLSIHAKFRLAGKPDERRVPAVNAARERLRSFLDGFETVIGRADQEDRGTFLGTDPKMGELGRRFVDLRRDQGRTKSPLFRSSFNELRSLLDATEPQDLQRLIEFLRDLRAIVEVNSHSDVVGMLGEI